MNYFIKVDGEEKGPLSADQIRQRLTEKTLTGDDLVRWEGRALWVRLGSWEEFGDVLTPPVPADGILLAYGSAAAAVAALFALLVLLTLPNPTPADFANAVALIFLGSILVAIVFGHVACSWLKRKETNAGRAARTGLRLGYLTLIAAVAITYLSNGPDRAYERGNITKGISNCRQIITTLKLYASDNKGKYPDAELPDAKSSNALFHEMFVGGEADNEMIFACPASKDGTPDGNIGKAPDFREAVRANENHWAMTKGLTDESDGKIPLVFENPQDATWPPKWNPGAAGTGKPGRAWSGGKVIIGCIDGSVSFMALESSRGEHVGLKPYADGKPVFPDLHPKPEILTPEVKE